MVVRSKVPDVHIPQDLSWPQFVFQNFKNYGDKTAIVSIYCLVTISLNATDFSQSVASSSRVLYRFEPMISFVNRRVQHRASKMKTRWIVSVGTVKCFAFIWIALYSVGTLIAIITLNWLYTEGLGRKAILRGGLSSKAILALFTVIFSPHLQKPRRRCSSVLFVFLLLLTGHLMVSTWMICMQQGKISDTQKPNNKTHIKCYFSPAISQAC